MDEMLRIAVFGDSLMKGTLPDEQLRYHFHTDLFEAPLAGLHAEVTNKSVFGATSRKGVTLVQRDLARGHRYDWALVEYGGNDCNYDWPDVAAHPEQDHDPVVLADEFRANMTAIVQMLREAGIRPIMITGDHKLTAVAIARELNIYRPGDLALTGEDLDFLPQEVLEQEVEKFSVYARVSPEHKMRIVKAWQARGKVVAMTGDGVNDAPALKVADIGCAMGVTGTDVAKGAADMILTDDNFATIVSAVEQGRGIYANIKKAIHYLLSCNIGEILTIFCATVFHFHQMPLVPVQLLWLNLVTDSLPALALGVEPVEEGVMSQPPRDAHASLFAHGFAFRLAWQGVMVGLLTLAAYFLGEYVLSDPGEAHAAANTMAFATLTLCQLFHAFDVRSERSSLFHIGVFSNPAMNKAFLIGLTMQLAVLCVPPLQVVFSTVPMSPLEWAVVLALAITPVVVCELAKAVSRGRTRRPARAEKVEPACARR